MLYDQGWEQIWQQDRLPKRFDSYSAPNSTVVKWADTLPPGAFVLDVGCGVGRHCVYLGGRGFRVAGQDISPTGSQKAIAACAARGVMLDGHVCNMTDLPWPQATFDAALSTSTIHHNLREDIQRSLDEVWRVLKPGGLALLDFPDVNTLDYALLRAEVAAGGYREPEPNTFIDLRTSAEIRDIDGYLPHHFSDEADLLDLLRHFEIVRLWEDLRPAKAARGPGMVGKWIAWLRKPSLV